MSIPSQSRTPGKHSMDTPTRRRTFKKLTSARTSSTSTPTAQIPPAMCIQTCKGLTLAAGFAAKRSPNAGFTTRLTAAMPLVISGFAAYCAAS